MVELRFGISPPMDLFDRPPDQRRAWVAAVEGAGLDHVFIADHVSFRGGQGIDAVTYLTALGALSDRLDLMAGVMLLALRHPMVAARQLNQLAQVAPGRLIVGVGVGGEDRQEFEVCGVDPATRGRRTDAALEIVRRLLAGDRVSWSDAFFDLSDARILPPIDPPIPFVVGGRSDAAIRRAGRLADGWLATWCSPRRFSEGVALAERSAEEAGRSPAWRHGLQLWVGADNDVEVARAQVARGMESFYRIPFDGFAKYTPAGSARDLADFLSPYVEAGAAVLNLTPRGVSSTSELEITGEVAGILRARFSS